MRKMTMNALGASFLGNKLNGKSFMKFSKAVLFMVAVFVTFVSVTRAQNQVIIDVTAFPYNAVGDNSTNNSDAIQRAVDDVADLGGGIVYFPQGLYIVSDSIHLKSGVKLQGMASWNNCQIRFTKVDNPLFVIEDKSDISFKDLYIMGWSRPIWQRSSLQETDFIRAENTTAISLKAGASGINNIEIENVRISQFTRGINATSTISSNDANITNVKIRNYASDGNQYALWSDTRGADNWDVQNMNIYPMYVNQDGIYLERSGQMRFLQLSCAGNRIGTELPGTCAILKGNGNLYFRNMHIEGPKLGFLAQSDPDYRVNNSRLTVENSATEGEFYRATNIVSINNRFWLDWSTIPRFKFFGNGANSSVQSCADVWVSGPSATHTSNTTVNPPSDAFPGLTNPALIGCVNTSILPIPTFDHGYIADEEINGMDEMNGEVNVTDYCLPDCPGDDTAAFQTALTKARDNYKQRIFVPSGTYEISETLELRQGETIRGGVGSYIHMIAPNQPIFKIVFRSNSTLKSITLRNLNLSANLNSGNVGILLESDERHPENGSASDFQIQNVNFDGFQKGILVRPLPGNPLHFHPMFDSVSVKDGEFTDNDTAIAIESNNASNWNMENIRVTVPLGKQGILINGAGVSSIRNLTCTGIGTNNNTSNSACLTVQRQSAIAIDGLTATNVGNALMITWENGHTQFPVTLRNSNLLAGVFIDGRVYLNSVSNIYPANIGSSPSPKVVRIGPMVSLDTTNEYYSDIFSCDDTFLNVSNQETMDFWIYEGNLEKPVKHCIIDDTF